MERTKNPIARFLIYVALLLFMLYSTVPFLWTFLNSMKRPKDAFARTPKFFNFVPTGENYAELWLNISAAEFVPYGLGLLALIGILALLGIYAGRLPIPNGIIYGGITVIILMTMLLLPSIVNTADFYDFLLNSIIVTIGTLAISLSVGCLAGYALARHKSILAVMILVLALAFRALPSMAFVLPFFYIGQLSGLYDTHLLLILTLVAVNQPFTIWMLRSFFMEVPHEIEEAAMMDGAGRLQAFLQIVIPIMWPGIITTGLFTLLLAYNDFLLARILTQTNLTLPVGIAQFTGGEDPGYITLAAAGSISITLPIIFVIIFFQKHLIKGLASGAVKG